MLALIVALAFTVMSSDTAHAAFLIPFAILGIESAFAIGAITFVVNTAVAFGLSYVASKLLGKQPGAPDSNAGGTELELRVDADIPQSLVFGYATTGGSAVYFDTYGRTRLSEADPNPVPNAFLIEIVALADHPCAGLVGVYLEGLPVFLRDLGDEAGYTVSAYTGTPSATTPEAYVGQFGGFEDGAFVPSSLYATALADGAVQTYHSNDISADFLHFNFHDGSQTEADAFVVSKLSSAVSPWTADYIGHGVTYAIQHSRYDTEKVPGRMRWRYVVKGIPLYDARLDTSVGGSGTHRFDDLSTHEWTENLAVVCYNICRGIYVADENGDRQFFYGLEGTTADQLPLDVWFAAMNECDVLVAKDGSSGTEKQFVAGGEVTVDTEPLETIKGLLKASGGRFVEIGGVYKLYLGVPGLPVLSFDDGSILASREDRFKPVIILQDRVNYLTGKYTAFSDGWLPKVADPIERTDWRTEDGRRTPSDLDAPMVQSDTQMQRLQTQMLNRSRRQRKHIVPLPPTALKVEPGDVVEWTSARNGYEAKLFECDGVDYEPNLITTLSMTEVDPTDYDWDGSMVRPVVSGRIISLRPAAKVIGGFAAEPFIQLAGAGIRRPAIRLSWDDPEDGDVVAVLWQVRRPSEPDDIMPGTFDDAAAGQVIIVGGLASLTDYEVRARFQSFNGFAADWSLWIPVTTPDVRVSLSELDDALNARLEQVQSQIPARLADFQEQIDRIGAALNGQITSMIERGGQQLLAIGARYQENSASINQIAIAYTSADEAQAELITALDSRLTTAEGDITGNATTISDLGTTVTNLDNTVQAQSFAITSTQATVTATNIQVSGNASAISGLDSRVTATENSITSQATQITSLNSSVSDLSGSIIAQSNALNALSTVVTIVGNQVIANSEAVTNVQAMAGDATASGMFRMVASATPSGAVSAIEMQAKAGSSGPWASAAIRLAAFYDAVLGHYSQIRLVGDQIIITDSADAAASDFDGTYIKTATIDTLQLKPGAILHPRSSVFGSTGTLSASPGSGVLSSWTDLASFTIAVDAVTDIVFSIMQCQAALVSVPGGGSATLYIRLVVDGVLVGSAFPVYSGLPGISWVTPMQIDVAPSVGTRVYKWQLAILPTSAGSYSYGTSFGTSVLFQPKNQL